MIFSIYGEHHTMNIGDDDEGCLFLGFDELEETFTLTKTDAAALMELLKLLLYKQ